MYHCKILLDSISETGKRLTTFEITFPRIVLAEFNTHRMLSRNSASSRAIPFAKQLERVMQNPFVPERFPKNGKGMQPQGYYEKESIDHKKATDIWLKARDEAIKQAKKLVGMDEAWLEDSGNDLTSDRPQYLHIHKQIANRLLEPFQWHTVICTATELSNFFKLRTHPDAQVEIKTIGDLMYTAYHAFDSHQCFDTSDSDIKKIDGGSLGWEAIRPQYLKVGEWHLPLVHKEDRKLIEDLWYSASGDSFKWITNLVGLGKNVFIEIPKMISVARCARVSYLTHDGKRDIVKDLELFERLKTSGHWSPFEHVATPNFKAEKIYIFKPDTVNVDLQSGNFFGWKQYRKEFQGENCTSF
jgi:thymidylate synthase ThyX